MVKKESSFLLAFNAAVTVSKVLWLILEAFWMALVVFHRLAAPEKNAYIVTWSQRVLNAFGLELHLKNKALLPSDGGYCLASNHISWIDIQVINSVVPCKFVSTTEVRSWPVVGKMVQASGAIFLDLNDLKKSTREVTTEMVRLLQAKDMVAFFPEATSSTGDTLLPFRSNLFQAAVESHAPVFPVCIRYLDAQGRLSTATGFHGDMTLLQCMQNIWRAAPLRAEVTVLPALEHSDNRKSLCRECESRITSAFHTPHALLETQPQ